MCRVSVIIPTYNRAHIVGEAIDSVLAQTYRDFEIIVVDDASTDNTQEVLARYLSEHGERIRYIRRETNGGAGAARNDGIRASAGEFIAFLDSDDLYLPRRLEAAVAFLNQNADLGGVYTDCQALGPDGQIIARSMVGATSSRKRIRTWRDVACYEPMNTDTITIRRQCLQQVGLFDERLRRGQDSDLWLRLSYHYPVGQWPEVLVIWRRRERKWVTCADARRAIGVWHVVLQWLQSLSPADVRFAKSRLGRAYWLLAVSLREEGDLESLRARQQAAGYSLVNRLLLQLIGGMAAWYVPALLPLFRGVRRHLFQFRSARRRT